MWRQQLHYFTEGNLLGVEWVQHLKEVSDLLIGIAITDMVHHSHEFMLVQEPIVVKVHTSEDLKEWSEELFMLFHLEVKYVVLEVTEIHFDIVVVAELTQ